jgi:hypothetical protein
MTKSTLLSAGCRTAVRRIGLDFLGAMKGIASKRIGFADPQVLRAEMARYQCGRESDRTAAENYDACGGQGRMQPLHAKPNGVPRNRDRLCQSGVLDRQMIRYGFHIALGYTHELGESARPRRHRQYLPRRRKMPAARDGVRTGRIDDQRVYSDAFTGAWTGNDASGGFVTQNERRRPA